MTGSCVLCGEVFTFTSEHDPIVDDMREARVALKFGQAVRKHIQGRHQPEFQDAMNAGMAFGGLVAMSYIYSTEPMFREDVVTVRDQLMKATEQKNPPPLVGIAKPAVNPTKPM